MSSLVVTDIGLLVTNDTAIGQGPLGLRSDAALAIEDGRVTWIGDSADAPAADERVDAAGACVIPGFVDSHAHLMFAGDRAEEFRARMNGELYAAGGIRTTVAATRAASDEVLRANAQRLLAELTRSGVTTAEIKSGYGLTVPDEARALRLARELTQDVTFLGAHVVPQEFAEDRDGYVDLVCGDMLTACAPHATWIDVFCEEGAFDADQSARILAAGTAAGLTPRIHANQLRQGPGVQVGVAAGAASADHCTHLSAADIDALVGSDTVATLVPGAELSTRSAFADGRALLDAGATVALATDCNPGSSYTTSMPMVLALAVGLNGLQPGEALWAATKGGARALRRDDVGHLGHGARADFVLLDAPSYVHLMYRPGVDQIQQVRRAGSIAYARRP